MRGPARWAIGCGAALVLVAAGFAAGRSTAPGGPTAGTPVGTAPATAPPTPSLDPVDVGFLQDMIDHHGQALVMSTYVARNGDTPAVRNMAWNIVLSQSRETGQLDGLLRARGLGAGDPTREVMAWMGMPVPLDRMPGLASQADLSALLNSSGPELDTRFLELMRVHHEGGVHMAEHARDHAADLNVREMAERIVVSQTEEIADIDQMLGS